MVKIHRPEITPRIRLVKDKVDKERNKLQKIEGVVATGITHSHVTGIDTHKPADQLAVYVQNKSVLKDVPSEVNGVKVVYKLTSGFKIVADSNRYRPIKQGSEITAASGLVPTGGYCWVGTMGGFPSLRDGSRVLLSNNHVIANDNPSARLGKVGDIIYQPGCKTEGIGTLSNWIPLNSPPAINLVDAAVAKINPDISIDEYTLCNYPINKTIPPAIGMQITKTGRTTGCTYSTIESIDAQADVDYSDDPNNPAIVHFEHQIMTGPGFCAGGDSGSVVVTYDNNRNAVGLLFAADNNGVTTLSPMTTVEQLLGVSFKDTGLPVLSPPSSASNTLIYVGAAGLGLLTLILLIDGSKPELTS